MGHRVLVAGATGNVGRELVEQLRAAGLPLRALTRHPERAVFPEDVAVVGGDLEAPSTLGPALEGVSAVFLMGPTSSVSRHAVNLCGLAAGAAVRQVVLLGSSIVELEADDPYSREHRQAEQAVMGSGLSWTILRPGAFTSNALMWADSIRGDGMVRSMSGNFPAAPIDPYDVAAVAFEALTSDAHGGRIYSLTGPERLRPADQVEILSRLLDRPLLFEELSTEDALAVLCQTQDAHTAASLLGSLRRPDVPWALAVPTVERLTGRPPRTFSDWASRNTAAFA
jgi:uncharacterized protein YbjT (DUF2867 family)